MSKLVMALGIGCAAGIIDIIPMMIKRLDRYDILSAFIHWVVLGGVIAHLNLPLAGWLKGLLTAEATALPIVILVAKTDPKSIPPILVMSALLGSAVGYAASLLPA